MRTAGCLSGRYPDVLETRMFLAGIDEPDLPAVGLGKGLQPGIGVADKTPFHMPVQHDEAKAVAVGEFGFFAPILGAPWHEREDGVGGLPLIADSDSLPGGVHPIRVYDRGFAEVDRSPGNPWLGIHHEVNLAADAVPGCVPAKFRQDVTGKPRGYGFGCITVRHECSKAGGEQGMAPLPFIMMEHIYYFVNRH